MCPVDGVFLRSLSLYSFRFEFEFEARLTAEDERRWRRRRRRRWVTKGFSRLTNEALNVIHACLSHCTWTSIWFCCYLFNFKCGKPNIPPFFCASKIFVGRFFSSINHFLEHETTNEIEQKEKKIRSRKAFLRWGKVMRAPYFFFLAFFLLLLLHGKFVFVFEHSNHRSALSIVRFSCFVFTFFNARLLCRVSDNKNSTNNRIGAMKIVGWRIN